MKSITKLTAAMACGLGLLAVGGCTRSFDYVYNSDVQRLGNADKLASVSIGVATFQDRRPWIEPGKAKSESFIAQQGPWKFGLSHNGQSYTPVNKIVQEIFIREFNNGGLKAKPIAQIVSKENRADIRNLGSQNGVDYVLGGEITVFEFVNETGAWTVTSRQSVSLSLILQSVRGDSTLVDETFAENARKNEGMAVLHETNVEKLMNGAFRSVVRKVVEQVATKLAMDARDIRIQLTADGRIYQLAFDGERITLAGSASH